MVEITLRDCSQYLSTRITRKYLCFSSDLVEFTLFAVADFTSKVQCFDDSFIKNCLFFQSGTKESVKVSSVSSKSIQKQFADSKTNVIAQKKSYLSPPRSSPSPVPPPMQFASLANNASAVSAPAQPPLPNSETDNGAVKGEQYSTFSASSKGANSSSSSSGKFYSYSKATKSETISSKSQQTKSSSSNLGSGSVVGGIQVLPMASFPVKLQEPPPQVSIEQTDSSSQKNQSRSSSKTGQKNVESIEADQFIEQLMREAETDPKLRELTYGKSGAKAEPEEPLRSMPPSGGPKIYSSAKPPPSNNTESPVLGESYPMVQRPYRTQQDMIIKERDDSPTNLQRMSGRPMERHKMQKRPYRTNEDIKIVDLSDRSKSADGRLNNNAYQAKDPKLDKFSSVASVEDVASATGSRLLGEVVTDGDHKSVRDLIRMMESNTHSESINPYVRKWGCDLISPEPHSKNITYRRERREMPKPFHWKPPPAGGPQSNDPRLAAHYSAHDQADHNQNMANDVSYTSGDNTNTTIDNEFNMNDHITDMGSLLGRQQSNNASMLNRYEEDVMNQTASSCMSKLGGIDDEAYGGPQRTATPVIWPPPSPIPEQTASAPSEVDAPYLPNGVASQSPIPPSPPPPPPALLLQGKAKEPVGRPVASQSMNGNMNGARNSLLEIDRQIVTIQNEFEAELDTLIDAYRQLQQSKRKDGVNVEGTHSPMAS